MLTTKLKLMYLCVKCSNFSPVRSSIIVYKQSCSPGSSDFPTECFSLVSLNLN